MQEKHEGSQQGNMGSQQQGSGQHRCSKCNQTFGSAEELRRHEQNQHQGAQGQSGQHEHSQHQGAQGQAGQHEHSQQQEQGRGEKSQTAKR